MTIDAHTAYELYTKAFETDAIIQGQWHSVAADGRQLACALGTLGPNVRGPADCPASVMPRWLAQMVPWFFDNQEFEKAKTWGLAFYAELDRINGQVPFSVIHDWQANIVGKIAQESAERHGRDASAHKALAEMQWKALTGEKFTADDWRPILKAAFLDVYKWRYADADADADANANAYADAYANADANAYANANAYADAYAYRVTITRLADGMVECLKRVPTPEA